MAYWRMQLHPNDSLQAMRHTVEALGKSFIGIYFSRGDPGDLTKFNPTPPLPTGMTTWDVGFATQMVDGDQVLVIVHNYPFALATVAGDYNYVRSPIPQVSGWFNHFRRVRDVKYYADRELNPKNWQELGYAGTIQILTDPTAPTYQLIASWQ